MQSSCFLGISPQTSIYNVWIQPLEGIIHHSRRWDPRNCAPSTVLMSANTLSKHLPVYDGAFPTSRSSCYRRLLLCIKLCNSCKLKACCAMPVQWPRFQCCLHHTGRSGCPISNSVSLLSCCSGFCIVLQGLLNMHITHVPAA